MDEDGSAEGGRTRLARGTKPNAAVGGHEHDGANADAAVPAATAPRGGDDARVRSALLTAPSRAGSVPASPGTTRRAARPSGAPEPSHAAPAPTGLDAAVGGPVSAGVEQGEMGGGDPDGSAGGARGQARGIDARGSEPAPARGAPSGAGLAPAQSICEAVEQLIEAQEADEAIAEWMRGGG